MSEKKFLIELHTEETPALLQLKIIEELEKVFNNEMKKINSEAFIIQYYISCLRMVIYYKGTLMPENVTIQKSLENSLNLVSKILPRTLQWPNATFKWIRPIRNLFFINNDENMSNNFINCFHLKSNNTIFIE